MPKNIYQKRRFLSEKHLANIFRWWSASAVYFFIGWGTGLGNQTTMIDFVFFLSIAIGLSEMFIVNPVIARMFNTPDSVHFRDQAVLKRVGYRLRYFLRVLINMVLVVLLYDIINLSAIALLGLENDVVFLPGEPIFFGIFYMLFYLLIDKFIRSVKKRVKEVV